MTCRYPNLHRMHMQVIGKYGEVPVLSQPAYRSTKIELVQILREFHLREHSLSLALRYTIFLYSDIKLLVSGIIML